MRAGIGIRSNGRRRILPGQSAAPSISALSANSGEDWDAKTLTASGANLADTTGVTVDGDAVDFVIDGSDVDLELPSRIMADTQDSEEIEIAITTPAGVATATYTYWQTPHSAGLKGLWDHLRGVTHAATATAIANVGTGGTDYNLTPCTSAQAYNSSDSNLGGRPSITMATGGYKTGTISIANPVFMFAIVFPEDPAAAFRTLFDGQFLFQRLFYKDSSTTKIGMYAGAFHYSTAPAINGAALVMALWNGASSEIYQDSATPEVGNPGAGTTTTSLTIGEAGDRGGAFPWLREIAMAGVHDSPISANRITRILAFARRVFGTT